MSTAPDGGTDDDQGDSGDVDDPRTIPEGHPAYNIVNAEGEQVCGRITDTTGDACQHTVSAPDRVCHMHPVDGSGPPEGHGSSTAGGVINTTPETPDPPDKPNLQHGLHCVEDDPSGVLQWIEDNDPPGYRWIEKKWHSYLLTGGIDPSTSQADDVLMATLMLYCVRQGRKRQVERGLTEFMKIETQDGVSDVDVEQESPVNLPTNRITREAYRILDRLNCLNSEDDDAGDAGDWVDAARRVAEANDAIDGDDNVIDVQFNDS